MTKLKKMPKTPKVKFLRAIKGVSSDMLNYSTEIKKTLGDTAQIDLGYLQLYASSNADFIKYVLQTNQKNYGKSRAYNALKLGLGNGLVTSKGSFWRKQRRLAQPVFYKKNLENLFQDMGRSTTEFLEYLEGKRGTTIDISREMMNVTATIVLRALFNVEQSESLDQIYKSMDVTQEYLMKIIGNPIMQPWYKINGEEKKFYNAIKDLDQLVYTIMNNRRDSQEKKNDLLQMLMDAEDADTGEKMTDLQLRDELVTRFSAGHETSSNALSWTFYLLCKNPETIQKLRAGINEKLPDQRMPSFQDLRELTYTRQVIEEGMRIYPPAWIIGRRALEDDEFNGFAIKKDVNMLLEIYGMHHSTTYWENPEAFNPDRFSPEVAKKRPKHHYLPFGAGPRMCIGNHFAMMEMQLLLATIMQRFDFELDVNHVVEVDPLITLRPKNGILLKVK